MNFSCRVLLNLALNLYGVEQASSENCLIGDSSGEVFPVIWQMSHKI